MEGGQYQIQIGEDVVTLWVSPWGLAHEPVEVDVHPLPKFRLNLPMAYPAQRARGTLYAGEGQFSLTRASEVARLDTVHTRQLAPLNRQLALETKAL
jgi:hypothetical protein